MDHVIVNPLTPEITVVLLDGVERVFRMNYNAGTVLEYVTVKEIEADGDAALMPMRVFRRKFYAGLHQDAVERGEEWTLKKCGEILPNSPAAIKELIVRISEVERLSRAPEGESKAGAAAGKKQAKAKKHPRR